MKQQPCHTLLWWSQEAGGCWGQSSLWSAQRTWAPCSRGWCRCQLSCSPTWKNRLLWWLLWGTEQRRETHCGRTPESLLGHWCFSDTAVYWLLPLIWLFMDTDASATPSPSRLLRTRPVTEKPMTRNMGWTQRNRVSVTFHHDGANKTRSIRMSNSSPPASNWCVPLWNPS